MGLFGRKQKRKLSREEERRQETLRTMEMQRQSFIRNRYTQYQIIGSGDGCDLCRSMKGKVFDVKDFEPGKTAPPFCVNCRCSVAPYMDKDKYNRWIDALSKGKNVRYKNFK